MMRLVHKLRWFNLNKLTNVEIKNCGIKKKNNDEMDYMKNLDCNNQIKIFINLEIIGEEKLYIFFKYKNFKKILQFSEAT